MPVETTEVGDVVVARPGDDLDMLGYQEFAQSIERLLHEGQYKIVVDLGRVTYVNSFAVRILTRLHERARRHFRLTNPECQNR